MLHTGVSVGPSGCASVSAPHRMMPTTTLKQRIDQSRRFVSDLGLAAGIERVVPDQEVLPPCARKAADKDRKDELQSEPDVVPVTTPGLLPVRGQWPACGD